MERGAGTGNVDGLADEPPRPRRTAPSLTRRPGAGAHAPARRGRAARAGRGPGGGERRGEGRGEGSAARPRVRALKAGALAGISPGAILQGE